MSWTLSAFHPPSCSPEHRLVLAAICSSSVNYLFLAVCLLSQTTGHQGFGGTLAAAETWMFAAIFKIKNKPCIWEDKLLGKPVALGLNAQGSVLSGTHPINVVKNTPLQ